jgi:hypothetical protein
MNRVKSEPTKFLVDWFVRRVYQELDGTLDDSIPKIPGQAPAPTMPAVHTGMLHAASSKK